MSEQAQIIRWENPPATTRRGVGRPRDHTWNQVAEQLRARPGQWAVVEDDMPANRTAIANHIRQGAILAFAPSGTYDATSRSKQGRVTIYARYVGDGDE